MTRWIHSSLISTRSGRALIELKQAVVFNGSVRLQRPVQDAPCGSTGDVRANAHNHAMDRIVGDALHVPRRLERLDVSRRIRCFRQ